MNNGEQKRAATMSLREFFQQHYATNYLLDAKPLTHTAYREALDHWERVTHDPQLSEIDSQTLAGFKAALRDPVNFGKKKAGRKSTQMTLFETSPQPAGSNGNGKSVRPLARATVNKHLRHINAILGKAGPPGPGNRDALGILDRVPWTKPVREYRRLPRNVQDTTLTAIYQGTATARFPVIEGVKPEHWWKALIMTALTVGFRREGLWALRWDDVDWQESTLALPAEGDKCNADRRKPVMGLVLKHLLRIRNGCELVFPWPHSTRTFYRQWHKIQDAGGIREEEHITLHDLKRACGTRFAKVASVWAVQKRLDHASLATSQHYVNATDEERDAVERMPIPVVLLEEFGEHGRGENAGDRT